jgi:hypothetical protein
MQHTKPTLKQVKEWKQWLKQRPENVRIVAEKFDPWTLFRLKTTNQRVVIMGFDVEPDSTVTVQVGVLGDYNLLTHQRKVFGIKPEDLEECDLPRPDEQVGSLDLPIETCKRLLAEHKQRN